MDGLNNVFADVDSIHKTDLLEVRLRVRAVANIPLTDKVAKRPHFWEVLSSLLINLFVKKDPRFRVSLNVKLTTLGSDPINFCLDSVYKNLMGSDPLTKFLSLSALKKLSSHSEIPGQNGSFLLTTFFLLILCMNQLTRRPAYFRDCAPPPPCHAREASADVHRRGSGS